MTNNGPAPVSVTIAAREWFDSHYGNTYFSARAWLDFGPGSCVVVVIPFEYGHGNEMITRAVIREARAAGLWPDWLEVPAGGVWQLFREHDIPCRFDVANVSRRKDLHRSPFGPFGPGRGLAVAYVEGYDPGTAPAEVTA